MWRAACLRVHAVQNQSLFNASHRANAQRQQFEQFMQQVPSFIPALVYLSSLNRVHCWRAASSFLIPYANWKKNTKSFPHDRPVPPLPPRPHSLPNRGGGCWPRQQRASLVQANNLGWKHGDQRTSAWICRRMRTRKRRWIGPNWPRITSSDT